MRYNSAIADILRYELPDGRYLKIDETAIKAGRTKTAKGKGKIKNELPMPEPDVFQK